MLGGSVVVLSATLSNVFLGTLETVGVYVRIAGLPSQHEVQVSPEMDPDFAGWVLQPVHRLFTAIRRCLFLVDPKAAKTRGGCLSFPFKPIQHRGVASTKRCRIDRSETVSMASGL